MDAPLPATGSVYRTLGAASAWTRIGVGFLDKSGWSRDQSDYDAPTWSLVLLLRGSGRWTAGGRTTPIAAGQCFQRVPGRRHTNAPDPSSGWFEAFLDLGPGLHRALAEARILPEPDAVWTPPDTAGALRRIVALRDRLDRAAPAAVPACYPALVALAQELMAEAPRHADGIDEACALLAEHHAARIDLRAWCRTSGRDYERFRKQFRLRTGLAPHQYRIRRRLEQACALLQEGRSVIAVAEHLGYSSPFEFSAQFKDHLGRSPSQYGR